MLSRQKIWSARSVLCPGRFSSLRYRASSSCAKNVKPFYITTPIFYPNSAPHIGHLYSLVTADIFARFQRLLDPNRVVHFLAGTDEHGLKIQKVAKDKGVEPTALCDEVSQQFRVLAKRANISHTRFIRTTEIEHHDTVKQVWRELDAKGLIYKGDYAGWYSVADECFYSDSQVTRLRNSSSADSESQLVISTETGTTVQWMKEENYMFRMSSFRESLLAHYKDNKGIIFPDQHYAHIVDILSSAPLDDLSISRPRSRLSWGIPVPNDPEHTIYVWFDALTIYLTGIGYPWRKGNTSLPELWPPSLQIVGKDILRFHAIYFPAILQALDLPLPLKLLSHAHWTMNQKKMSKSVGNVVDPIKAINQYGVDVVRYYLARIGGRFRDDVDWSESEVQKYREEIQSFIGNFFLRVTSDTMMKRIEGAPQHSLNNIYTNVFHSASNDPNRDVITTLMTLAWKVKSSLCNHEIGEALQEIISVLRQANAAMTTIAPWLREPHIARASHDVSLETLRICGVCIQPFVPSIAGKLLDVLGVPVHERTLEFATLTVSENSTDIQEKGRVGSITRGVKIFESSDFRRAC